MAKKLVIIDSYSLANRAFFALPPLATIAGQPTNAVYGMAMMLLRLLEERKPEYFIAAFDVSAPTFRHLEYKEYKGQRLKMEDSLRTQIPIIRQLLEVLRIPIYEKSGYEADDIIGTLATQACGQGIEVEIVTGDRDSFQLVRPGIKVLYTRKGISEVDTVDEAFIQNRYQLTPGQLIDLKGLMGDPSDNIPGLPGFGEKTALKYLYEFHSIDLIYQNIEKIAKQKDRELLNQYKEQVYLSKRLVKIITDIEIDMDLESCSRHGAFDKNELINFCKEYEITSLARKLAGDGENVAVKQMEELECQTGKLELHNIDKIIERIREEKLCFIQWVASYVNWREVKLLGFGLGDGQSNWFISLTPDATLPGPVVEILNDPGIVKIGHDLKKQMQIAAVKGISIHGKLEDTLIAGYLVNAGLGGLELEELCEFHLKRRIPAWRNERGKVFSAFAIPENVSEEALQKITGGRLEGIKMLYQTFRRLIAESPLESLYKEVEMPLTRVLFEMEHRGIKVNPGTLSAFGKVLKARQMELEAEIYQLAETEFNINSPKQLGTILFEKLALKAPKKNKTGFSTDAEVLESLADQHPIIPKILEYRQNTKLQTTYIDSLITLINPASGRVHTTFNQAVTTTGRLSSTEPNLQNIPIRSEEGKMIRRAFITEENHCLLAADYSQIELRVMAHFSQDPAFKEAFLKGDDIHRFTAAAVYNIPVNQVTKEMRAQAKAVNFGIIYGISGFGLAKNIGVTRKEADIFIEAYFTQYPGVKVYVEKLIEEAREAGEAITLMGRIRKLPDLQSRNFTLRSFAERMARNTPIQGTAADIIKIAMVKIIKQLHEKPELGELLLQVHDELVFEVSELNWRELAKIVKAEMESAVTLSVPVVVDLKMGSNWGEMNPVEL